MRRLISILCDARFIAAIDLLKDRDIWEIYLKQDKRCFFTKLPIGFCDREMKSDGYCHTASVDRIDSSKGYTKNNICLVYKDINFMKQDFSVEQFVA